MERPFEGKMAPEFIFPSVDDPADIDADAKPLEWKLPNRPKRIGPKPGRETPGGWRR